jgi:hypothetical protein
MRRRVTVHVRVNFYFAKAIAIGMAKINHSERGVEDYK